MKFKDYYETLGVPPGADADVIKSAYRKLARKYHPDVSKEKDAEDRFKAVNEAYEVLKDPKKREAYDELRAGGYRPGEEFRGPPPGFRREHGDFDFDIGDGEGFSDFFESLFGRFRGGGPAPHAQRRAHAPRATRARLPIELERVHEGGRERISVDGKTLEVNIPRGIEEGKAIRLAGQGPGGGDLLLEIAYKPHRLYSVDGRNLTLKLPVAPWEAALGATVPVPTLGGEVELRIPAGSTTGRKLRLKGRGLPGDPPGDQYVVFEVQSPAADTAAQRDAYESLRRAFADFDPRRPR